MLKEFSNWSIRIVERVIKSEFVAVTKRSTKGVAKMKTTHIQIEEAYDSGDMVTVCWEDDCSMHRLYYWEDEKWVPHKKRKNYTNFTHSICEVHYRVYQEELGQLIEEEEAAAEAVIAREVAIPVAAS